MDIRRQLVHLRYLTTRGRTDMARPYSHIVSQGPVIATLARTAAFALRQRISRAPRQEPALPGPTYHAVLPPRPASLVADYIRHVGGNPYAYLEVLPAHLWPQWGFPLAAKTLDAIPYPLLRVLNGGCRLELRRPLPQRESLIVRAKLESIDDDGRRAVLHQSIVTGTDSAPDAVVAHLYAIVPLGSGKGGDKKRREQTLVPPDATLVDRWHLGRDAGLEFAMLTGDFNPVHWAKPYARAFGFKSTILHGFSTMARAIESIHRHLLDGDTTRLRVFDVKFTRPLVLPAETSLFALDKQVFVGAAPGEAAVLAGSFEAD